MAAAATSHEDAARPVADPRPGHVPGEGWPRPAWILWGATRIALGLIFLWAFLDKLLGLGFSTAAERAWTAGGSPTRGYLSSSVGPFAEPFRQMAGNPIVDALFMAGLLAVGVSLALGIAVRMGAWAGTLMLLMMYLSHPVWALESGNTHPFLDDHIVYAMVLVTMAWTRAGHSLGLGGAWRQTPLVRKVPWLE